MNNLALIGSVLLALCGLPIAIDAIRNKHSDINLAFYLMWFFGEVFTVIYVLYIQDYYLLINYGFNVLFLLIVGYYRFFHKESVHVRKD